MKRIIIAVTMAIAMVGCTNKVEKEYIALINESTAAIDSTTTQEDFNKVSDKYLRKLSDFAEKNADALKKVTENKRESGEIMAAQQAFNEAYTKKLMDLNRK